MNETIGQHHKYYHSDEYMKTIWVTADFSSAVLESRKKTTPD